MRPADVLKSVGAALPKGVYVATPVDNGRRLSQKFVAARWRLMT